jgi:predicted DsbA family dithiol-disulfide isomerase
VQEPDPPAVEFYGDFNCPFCHALDERLWEAGLGGATRFRPVQHLPELPVPRAADPPRAAVRELEAELERLGLAFPELELHPAPARPNTELACIYTAAAALDADPALRVFVRAVFRAVWVEGLDISLEATLRAVAQRAGLAAHALGDRARTEAARWQVAWEAGPFQRRLPALRSPHGAVLLGLHETRRVVVFLEAGRFGGGTDEAC